MLMCSELAPCLSTYGSRSQLSTFELRTAHEENASTLCWTPGMFTVTSIHWRERREEGETTEELVDWILFKVYKKKKKTHQKTKRTKTKTKNKKQKKRKNNNNKTTQNKTKSKNQKQTNKNWFEWHVLMNEG